MWMQVFMYAWNSGLYQLISKSKIDSDIVSSGQILGDAESQVKCCVLVILFLWYSPDDCVRNAQDINH